MADGWTIAVGLMGIGIAGLGAGIAYGQFYTARQKLVMDLFDKRYQVFLDVRTVASHAAQTGKLPDRNLTHDIIARGRFLFGPEMLKAFERLSSDWSALEDRKDPLASERIRLLYDDMLVMFEEYLSMRQKLPGSRLREIARSRRMERP